MKLTREKDKKGRSQHAGFSGQNSASAKPPVQAMFGWLERRKKNKEAEREWRRYYASEEYRRQVAEDNQETYGGDSTFGQTVKSPGDSALGFVNVSMPYDRRETQSLGMPALTETDERLDISQSVPANLRHHRIIHEHFIEPNQPATTEVGLGPTSIITSTSTPKLDTFESPSGVQVKSKPTPVASEPMKPKQRPLTRAQRNHSERGWCPWKTGPLELGNEKYFGFVCSVLNSSLRPRLIEPDVVKLRSSAVQKLRAKGEYESVFQSVYSEIKQTPSVDMHNITANEDLAHIILYAAQMEVEDRLTELGPDLTYSHLPWGQGEMHPSNPKYQGYLQFLMSSPLYESHYREKISEDFRKTLVSDMSREDISYQTIFDQNRETIGNALDKFGEDYQNEEYNHLMCYAAYLEAREDVEEVNLLDVYMPGIKRAYPVAPPPMPAQLPVMPEPYNPHQQTYEPPMMGARNDLNYLEPTAPAPLLEPATFVPPRSQEYGVQLPSPNQPLATEGWIGDVPPAINPTFAHIPLQQPRAVDSTASLEAREKEARDTREAEERSKEDAELRDQVAALTQSTQLGMILEQDREYHPERTSPRISPVTSPARNRISSVNMTSGEYEEFLKRTETEAFENMGHHPMPSAEEIRRNEKELEDALKISAKENKRTTYGMNMPLLEPASPLGTPLSSSPVRTNPAGIYPLLESHPNNLDLSTPGAALNTSERNNFEYNRPSVLDDEEPRSKLTSRPPTEQLEQSFDMEALLEDHRKMEEERVKRLGQRTESVDQTDLEEATMASRQNLRYMSDIGEEHDIEAQKKRLEEFNAMKRSSQEDLPHLTGASNVISSQGASVVSHTSPHLARATTATFDPHSARYQQQYGPFVNPHDKKSEVYDQIVSDAGRLLRKGEIIPTYTIGVMNYSIEANAKFKESKSYDEVVSEVLSMVREYIRQEEKEEYISEQGIQLIAHAACLKGYELHCLESGIPFKITVERHKEAARHKTKKKVAAATAI
ncbi:hypothetical protein [Aureibacter tunicatorum]|uniref:Uncharacterized protein n=1 Tax=Aureibacter tunicatorum TaxID=866807 RepID=A0AAE3XTR2_9BACT|nr:hypothetical protein [Aureibacter tunicatorum]MDR6241845.1 hypothetical protein [Aureibacter tunicatorum]BDD07092.1 hypothetical protein AUTU_45750 [Aureibacter tunicatorum]